MSKALILFFLVSLMANAVSQVKETPAEKAKRMAWFKEARFGMFIHWGLYAIPAGKWGNSDRYGEWIRESAHIPVDVYEKFQPQFNPVNFRPDEWMDLAKNAGMKYVVITSKHHDGFGLFDSKLTDWDVMNTPYGKDIMKQIAESARKKGLMPCWYHSIMDWHHPDYLPRRSWEDRPVGDANFDRFFEYLKGQVTELLTNYGKIGIMWFDGEWEATWNHKYGQQLYDLCRNLQPNVIVNNRVDVGRGGMAGLSDAGYAGDYGTPEQEVPARGLPGVDWESCITMNHNWGYNAADKNFKSTVDLIKLLVDVVSKGGNLLLNIGPKADGSFPQESVDRLKEMAVWMKTNSQAIHGTEASVFPAIEKGWRCTRKGNSLYIHLFDQANTITLPGLANPVKTAAFLGGGKVTAKQTGTSVILSGLKSPAGPVPVVKVELVGAPKVYETPTVLAAADILVDRLLVSIANPSKSELRYTTDGTAPTAKSARYRAPFAISGSCTVSARLFANGKPVSEIGTRTFRKVSPQAASNITSLEPGLILNLVSGPFEKCAQVLSASTKETLTHTSLGLPKQGEAENIGLVYSGYFKVPSDGVYAFSMTSDDGSTLEISDQMVIDNDGLHSATEKQGVVALAAGWHPIRVVWFNRTGGYELRVVCGKAGDKLKPIPTSDLGFVPLEKAP